MLYGMASAGTVAWVMYQKFCNGLPYYRQEKDWKQYGVEITRATMANWVIRNSEAFFFLCTNTSTGNFWNVDSRWQMKRHFRFCMNRNAALRQSHICGCSAAVKTEEYLLSSINIRRPGGDNAVDFLHGFKGYLMCDGYSGYNKVPDAKRTACWAHIRRYLADAIPKGKALDYTLPSVQGMLYINQLFHLEDVIRSKYSSFDAIKRRVLKKKSR